MSKIVRYETKYEDAVLSLARKMHSESKTHCHIPFSSEKMVNLFNSSISKPNTVYLGLAIEDEKVFGWLLGFTCQPYFSTSTVSSDLALFIDQEKRGGIAAVRLIHDFERWSKENGVIQVHLSQWTGVSTERTGRLYQHLGYKSAGQNSVRVL